MVSPFFVAPALSRDPYRAIYRSGGMSDGFFELKAVGYRSRPSPGRQQTLAPTSRVAAILAEQVELLLHRTIGEREQHRVRVGLMRDPLPARHHEQVARAPVEGLLADPRASAPFDRREHRRVGGTIARGLESLRQQLNEGADGRHSEIAGLGVGEFQL